MFELCAAGPQTYYVNCPSRIGICRLSEQEICLIDSGNDKDAGKKIIKILSEQGWRPVMVLNTHSHADHIGGNAVLRERLDCPAYIAGPDRAFAEAPILEPAFLYGGYPCKKLRNKTLLAQPSEARELTADILPAGMELLPLPGHSFAMTAFHTADDVWFVGDAVTSPLILEKYPVSFVYDVAACLDSLDRLEQLEGRLFVPSHAEPTADIRPLVQKNREKLYALLDQIRELCAAPVSFETLFTRLFQDSGYRMDLTQYVLSASTVRSCLSYLCDRGELTAEVEEHLPLWKTV